MVEGLLLAAASCVGCDWEPAGTVGWELWFLSVGLSSSLPSMAATVLQKPISKWPHHKLQEFF